MTKKTPPKKPISIPSDKMIKEGDKLKKKVPKGAKVPTNGGYSKGGKVKCK